MRQKGGKKLKRSIKMLINVVNFLLFAHISFGIVCGDSPSLSITHSHLCALLFLSLFNEKFMTWPFSGCASCWLFAAFIWRSAGYDGGSCWFCTPPPPRPRARTTPINKFIALINNCNTVGDCSLNGNGFMKYTVLAGIAFLPLSSIAFQVSFGKVLSNYARIFNKLISHILTLGIFSKGSPSLPAPPVLVTRPFDAKWHNEV